MNHFNARAFGLIVVPISVYLFWFYVHFAVLNESGPGDTFMSAGFQETLKNSAIKMKSLGKTDSKVDQEIMLIIYFNCRYSLLRRDFVAT